VLESTTWEIYMKTSMSRLVLVALVMACGQSLAQTKDDTAWINRCIADNKDEGATQTVIRAYCECMNNEMSDNETLSISAWEKRNPKTQAMCSKKAGWK
jgi:hypothetical protein